MSSACKCAHLHSPRGWISGAVVLFGYTEQCNERVNGHERGSKFVLVVGIEINVKEEIPCIGFNGIN